MRPWTPNDRAAAADFLDSLEDPTQRGFLALLIASPEERFDTAAVAGRLGLSDHREAARATYAMGEALAARGLSRPWGEGQLGYVMAAETANLFRDVSPAEGA